MAGSTTTALIFTAACFLVSDVTAQPPKPNIVFIMADDLGFNDVSYHGFGEINTPNIDNLANNGVRLENYYVGPTCGPTRSQFLSGKYAIHLGLHNSNLDTCTKDALPSTEKTIADVLKTEGYATHLIGKWHAGFHHADFLPTNRGFDTFRGFLLSHGDHFKHDAQHRATGIDYVDYHNNTDPYTADVGVYSTTAFTERAKELINDHDTDTPMFMYLSYQAPHSPSQYPSGFKLDRNIKVRDRKRYAAMVTVLDEAVGEVVSALTTAGMLNDTVIIFSSDNGGSNNEGASNFPLRGQKGTYYQGGVKAVGFVSSPLLTDSQKGKEVDDLIHVTDWLPTMLSIAGGSVGNLTLDGLNQWNTIKSGASSSRTEILLNIGRKKGGAITDPFDENVAAAMIEGEWKILTGRHTSDYLYPNPSDDYTLWDSVRGIRTPSTTTKLFNLTDDAGETKDLSSSNTAKRDELLEKLRAYQLTMVPAIDDQKDEDACDPAKHSGYWGPWTV